MGFFESIVKELLLNGHTVDIACQPYHVPEIYSDLGCRVFPLSCSRSMVSKGNFEAIKEIRDLVVKEKYDIVHCHTPIAAFCTRVACRKIRKKGTKVIYTAHGFHFYKGAPVKNWLLFYPVEWICSWWTDVLITINKEDYSLARKSFHSKKTEYVPGVGIDISRFSNEEYDPSQKRNELGLPQDAKVILSVGELNRNKNHRIVLKALGEIDNTNIYYLIAGQDGTEKEILLRLATEIGMEGRFQLLGYRNDVDELYKSADLFILPSIREGLSVSTMEALACGTEVLISNIRGNVDLVDSSNSFDPLDSHDLSQKIMRKLTDLSNKTRKSRLDSQFEIINVNNKIRSIYASITFH